MEILIKLTRLVQIRAEEKAINKDPCEEEEEITNLRRS